MLDASPEDNQVVWRVDSLDPALAESLLRALAAQFRGDPAATDTSHVLRIPRFRNGKYNERFFVRAIQGTDQVYQLRDFVVHEDSPDRRRALNEAQEPARRVPSGHRSQSEADWAYAKRALARGDDPQEIMRRIAERFRDAILQMSNARNLLIDFWIGHANREMSGRYGKQLLANIQWRQECAAAIGLGFRLPANSQESVMDKFGQVFGAEELEAVSV